MKRALQYLAIAIGVFFVVGVWLAIRWDYIRIRPADRAVEQDAVYEAVLRSVEPTGNTMQLAFDERTSGNRGNDPPSQCATSLEHELQRSVDISRRAEVKPVEGSVYDWLYVVLYGFPYDAIDATVYSTTISDFAREYCEPGPLSQTFQTDIPKEFVDALKAYALEEKEERETGEPVHDPEHYCFCELSKVGFDSTFREAIVSWSHCGGGTFFVLKKSLGRWRVVGTLTNWVALSS